MKSQIQKSAKRRIGQAHAEGLRWGVNIAWQDRTPLPEVSPTADVEWEVRVREKRKAYLRIVISMAAFFVAS